MKNALRRLILAALLVATLAAPSFAAAAPANDAPPGWDFNALVHPYGGTQDTYTQGATKDAGSDTTFANFSLRTWDMFYTWTAPIAGTVSIDLCQTSPGIGGEWYLTVWDYAEPISPTSYDAAESIGCSNASMPQASFTATAGKKYRIAIGGRYTQAVLALLRISYLPQLDARTTIAGNATSGQTLTATPPTWITPADKHTLSWANWYRCDADGSACTPIDNRGDASYVLQPADVGSRIKVSYTATNAAGSVDATSDLTSVIAPKPADAGGDGNSDGPSKPAEVIAPKPVDADGDGIPDELVAALGIPTGSAGYAALCARYTLCKDDATQRVIFNSITSFDLLDGAVLDVLLGSIKPEILIANPSAPGAGSSKARLCDGAGGNDVCVGSSGPDHCIAYIGDGFCLGNKGNDTCVSKAGNDVCYGGEGADTCLIQPTKLPGMPLIPKAECFGGSGADACFVNLPANPVTGGVLLPQFTCAGGPANDTCKAAAVKLVNGLQLKKAGVLRMNCKGDAGNDTCSVAQRSTSRFASITRSVCNGGTGSDMCVAAGAASWTDGKLAAFNSVMHCLGGPGDDTLWTLNGKGGDRINGGGQKGDYCFADETDIVSGCGQTLHFTVSAADLKLLGGTPAQRAQFVEQSIATLNKKPLAADAEADVAAAIAAIAAALDKAQVATVRSVMSNAS